MAKTRKLTAQEKHELIYALSIARNNNNRHARECLKEASHAQETGAKSFEFLAGESERYEMWADLDEVLQELVSLGRIVILEDEE